MPEAQPEGAASSQFESYPLSRGEYISALVHLYRGQLARADAWRARLDTTSNWAVVTTMGLLSFAFSSPESSHASLLVGMVMISHFLLVEARRYRVFDVWNCRVRMIEENFYGPILTRDLESPRVQWGRMVADDLLHPRFKITYLQAMRARLMRNYSALYLLLAVAWGTKLVGTAFERGWTGAMRVGPVPGPLVLVSVVALYAALAVLAFAVERVHPPEAELWKPQSPVREHF
jgi:uncharacterized membrane protein